MLVAGVRYLGPGKCRHTYVSQLLTTGIASIDWIAEQMEPTNGNMIRQHYGTWINEDGPDVAGMPQLALKLEQVEVGLVYQSYRIWCPRSQKKAPRPGFGVGAFFT